MKKKVAVAIAFAAMLAGCSSRPAGAPAPAAVLAWHLSARRTSNGG